jgi:hypothetical protein
MVQWLTQPGNTRFFFHIVKEVEDIGLTNQPCKRSNTFLEITKKNGVNLLLVFCSVLLRSWPGHDPNNKGI